MRGELSSRSSLPAERGTNKRINVVTTDIAVKAQEEILSFDVSDEVLEIAAAAASTLASPLVLAQAYLNAQAD